MEGGDADHWGDQGLVALYDDMEDLGEAIELDLANAKDIAGIVVQYAGALAIKQEMDDHSDGVLTFNSTTDVLTVDLSSTTWDFGIDGTFALPTLVEGLLVTASGDQPEFAEWLGGRLSAAEIFDFAASAFYGSVPSHESDGTAIFVGSASTDNISGSSEDDIILGGSKEGVSSSGSGDLISGGEGNDLIVGSDGSDILLDGGDDDDIVFGGRGNDTLRGGEGNDLVLGGQGEDAFELDSDETGVDLLAGGSDADTFTIDYTGDSPTEGPVTRVIFGGSGSDEIHIETLVGDQVQVRFLGWTG